MANPENIKQTLLSEIEGMGQYCGDFCKRPGIGFTRDRKIPFCKLLHFQISMESGSIGHELPKYFDFDTGTPSLSAFYQQRAKLSDDALPKTFLQLQQELQAKIPAKWQVPAPCM